jgi:regulator of sigma E protease
MSLGMKFNKEAKALGFQDHDILLGTDKGTFKDFNADLYRGLAEAHRCDIIRNGRHISIAMPGDINMIGMLKTQPKFVQWFTPSTVDSVMKGSPAEKIGMLKNDSIIEFNGRKIDSYNEFQNEIGRIKDVLASANTHSDSLKALTTTVAFVHKGDTSITKKPVTLSSDVLIGIAFTNVLAEYKTTHITYTFLSSLPAGIKYGWDVLKGYVDDFKYVFTADGAKSLGGFGAIGSLFPPMWDWHAFWMMTAFLSIILAFMNILPIPALDGGHVFFLCYEMITRRKPSDKFMIRAEYVGITILLLLMIVANMNDILRWLGYM